MRCSHVAWTTVAGLLLSLPAWGQSMGGGSSGGGLGGGSFGGGGGSGASGVGNALSFGDLGGSGAGFNFGGSSRLGQTSGASSAVAASNIFARSFANPYYQGIPTSSGALNQPGGFGQVLYSTSGTTGSGRTTGGMTAGAGTAAISRSPTAAGISSTSTTRVAFAAVIRFPKTPISSPQLATDLQQTIANSSMLSNPNAIEVVVNGRDVTLRGVVADPREMRLVEGMVRLTPGVGQIKNELRPTNPNDD